MLHPELYIADNRIHIVTDSETGQSHTFIDGREQSFSRLEQSLLNLYAGNVNTVVDHDSALETLTLHHGGATINTVRVVQSHIRKKLGNELGNNKTGALQTRYLLGITAVRSLLTEQSIPAESALTLAAGRITFDPAMLRIKIDNRFDQLSLEESMLLHILGRNAGCVVGRRILHDRLYLHNYSRPDDVLRLRLCRLRKRLGKELGNPRFGAIVTIPTVGFKAIP